MNALVISKYNEDITWRTPLLKKFCGKMNALVISKYNEDTTWMTPLLKKFWVSLFENFDEYNGSDVTFLPGYEFLRFYQPNVGREAANYLKHIILTYYDGPTPYTIFTQGNPFDHCKDFLEKIEHLEGDYIPLSDYFTCSSKTGLPHHRGLKIEPLFKQLFEIPCPDTFLFRPNAIFAVSDKAIKSRPIDFYIKMLNLMEHNKQAPWVYERLWHIVFNPKVC